MSRQERTAALEEKKRRLDALRARRNDRSGGTTTTTAVAASKSGSLNDYIDGLLNSPPPVVAPPPVADPPSATGGEGGGGEGTGGGGDGGGDGGGGGGGDGGGAAGGKEKEADSEVAVERFVGIGGTAVKEVETFAMSTQTEDDDFPPPPAKPDDKKDEPPEDSDSDTDDDKENDEQPAASSVMLPEPKLLNAQQVNDAVANRDFSAFFTSASKKVERLLGAPILADLLVDDSAYSNSKPEPSADPHARPRHPLISAQVSFSFPRWTRDRDITSIDFSPHHRGQLMLASYHSPAANAATDATSNTATPSLKPHPTPAAALQPTSRGETVNADGLCILWNLTMPGRPEQIFTCGSPVLRAKFHPAEPTLVIGACHSGQIVVWDTRSGRLPVQRSSLNIFKGPSSPSTKNAPLAAGGHVHPVVGMELLDDGSALVTASSDGTVNFWSLSNLRDPAETIHVPGNISSLSIAPESQSILLGDESGAMHCIVSSSAAGTSASQSQRSSNARRVTRRLQEEDSQSGKGDGGSVGGALGGAAADQQHHQGADGQTLTGSSRHFGMVTGVATKNTAMLARSGSGGVSMARGFVRGANGLALSCGVDWTTKLWAPAYSDKPLMNILSHSYDYMCDVQWSPVHPSIFATASSNGTLSIWNLATSLDEPITGPDGVMVRDADVGPADEELPSSYGLNKIKWSNDGRRIVAASWDTLHVFGMADELWKPKGDSESRMMDNLKGRGLLLEA